MRALIAMPCLYGAGHTQLAIESVINSGYHDLLLIDNGSSPEVKNVINGYLSRENVHIISNQENIYVNPAWNQAAEYFQSRPQYDVLILVNSDLILRNDWHIALEVFYNNEDNANKVPVPIITDHPESFDRNDKSFTVLTEGIPGVFIVLPRKAVELVFPIPAEIRVWFGDNWCYDLSRALGFETGVLRNLVSYHYHGGSQSVQRTPDVYAIIEADKVLWRNKVEPKLLEKIRLNRTEH